MYVRILFTAAALGLMLAYSTDSNRADDGPPKSASAKKDAKAEAPTALKLYHASAVKVFIDTPGFGHERMVPVRLTIEKVDVTWTSEDIDREEPKLDLPSLAKPHRKRDTMLGKEAKDRLMRLPGTRPTVQDSAKKNWKLHSIDLLAVIDRDMPIVHVAVPTQIAYPGLKSNQPSPVPHFLNAKGTGISFGKREPDPLELAALDRFKDGEDVVIRTKGNVLRMVGALRATKQCLECHEKSKEGDLFGAFTYTLTKVGQ